MLERFDKGWEASSNSRRSKIISFHQATSAIRRLRVGGLSTILVQGTYDLPQLKGADYAQHLYQLAKARELADVVFVGLENDDTVRLNKPKGTVSTSLAERMVLLAGLETVDFVFGFIDAVKYGDSDRTYQERYRILRPSLLSVTTGGNQVAAKTEQARTVGVDVAYIELPDCNSPALARYLRP